MNKEQPSIYLISQFQHAFDYFNAVLFDKKLTACMITIQRNKSYYGAFFPDRWADVEHIELVHEIGLNTSYFHERTLFQILETLGHQMCHLWQHLYGSPSRNGYHNGEWSEAMQAIGLMPSDTFNEGGKITGQKMGEFTVKGGRFEQACIDLITSGFEISLIDRYQYRIPYVEDISIEALRSQYGEKTECELHALNTLNNTIKGIDMIEAIDSKKQLTGKHYKYQCQCQKPISIYGKPNLQITCNKCEHLFLMKE